MRLRARPRGRTLVFPCSNVRELKGAELRGGGAAPSVQFASSMETLLDVFYPPSCLACMKLVEGRAYFCEDCSYIVETLPSIHCVCCAEPGKFSSGRCQRCEKRPPPFSRSYAPFVHAGAVAHAIHLYKYEDRPELARPLAKLLFEGAKHFLEPRFALIPIPLHRRRYISRRYDQAGLLAHELSALSEVPVVWNGLNRTKETQRQVGLDEVAREANLADAFEATPALRGLRLVLIDDVFTTGATARAAARAVLNAGAREVRILTLARAWSM